jgi:small subunit ribosomal protein S3
MIEREFIKNKTKNMRIRARINKVVGKGAACGDIVIEKTPLGEKIIINTIRPGLVIGRSGETIKRLTAELKSRYRMENPQIEVREITSPGLVAATVAKRIADEMERFGPQRYKAMGYRSLAGIMRDGAMGAEIVISGRGVPSQRSKTWRFNAGYLKKCGDIAVSKIDKAIAQVHHKSGSKGIQVRIMLPGTFIPDKITIQELEIKVEIKDGVAPELKEIVEGVPVETSEAKVAKPAIIEKVPAKEAVAKIVKPATKAKAIVKKAVAKPKTPVKKITKKAPVKAKPATKKVVKKVVVKKTEAKK